MCLLYTVYIAEADAEAWQFSNDNPSEIKVIENKNGVKLLVDRFTDQAIWFGAFDEKNLVGCSRLVGKDTSGKLEVEGYPTSQYVTNYINEFGNQDVLEVTRGAIAKAYSGQGVFKVLLTAIFEYCLDHRKSLLVTTHKEVLVNFYQRIGWPLKQKCAFKYEEIDPKAVDFFYADYEKDEIKKITENLVSSIPNTKPPTAYTLPGFFKSPESHIQNKSASNVINANFPPVYLAKL